MDFTTTKLLHGGDYVREENLAELLQWYETR